MDEGDLSTEAVKVKEKKKKFLYLGKEKSQGEKGRSKNERKRMPYHKNSSKGDGCPQREEGEGGKG